MSRNYAHKQIHVKKIILWVCVSVLLIFIVPTILVSFLSDVRVSTLGKWSRTQSLNNFMYVLEKENRYFTQEFQKQEQFPHISSILFSLITNIQFRDIGTLIRDEIPGFSKYYSQIAVAGEGTNETNIPHESDIPLEELTKPRQANTDILKEQQPPSSAPTNQEKIALIYYSHNRESFLPLLPGTTNPNSASSAQVNVSLLGERLAVKLEEKGIGTINNKTDIVDMLLKRGLNYVSSYEVSREVVEEALAQTQTVQYLIDIHRDSSRKALTTKVINGKPYGRLYFVVGKEHKHYQENLQFAKEINAYLDKNYYGISRGIFIKDRKEGNGVYNQDLSPQSMLVEIGGVDNNLDELYRTVDVLAEAISNYHQQAEKVNKQQ